MNQWVVKTGIKKFRTWLITGGCGFIGRNLIHHLREMPVETDIRILDNLSAVEQEGSLGRSPGCSLKTELLVGDVREEQICRQACEGIDVVVHLAASSGIAPSVANPRLNLESNVTGTFNMLEAARQAGVKTFVFASSNASLGDVPPPFHEQQAPRPVSPYGAGKLAGEAYCHAYEKTYRLKTVILRFSNVYGPHSGHKDSVVAKFFKVALLGGPIVIFGNGMQTRDFIYVDDLCRALLDSVATDHGENVFHIATNRETTINEIASRIQTLVNRERLDSVSIRYEPARSGDVQKNYANTSRSRRILGFVPQVDLETGLKRTFEYYLSRRNQIP